MKAALLPSSCSSRLTALAVSDLFKRIATWPWRLVKGLATWLLALVLLFEEWGWEPLARFMAWIGSWPGFRWIEARIKGLPPYGALALFAVPVLALLPLKLLALYWLSHGHKVLGISVFLAAKVGVTAITARLFMLTKDTLMQLAWFAHWFNRWMVWKAAVLLRVRQSAMWLAMGRIKRDMRQALTTLADVIKQQIKRITKR